MVQIIGLSEEDFFSRMREIVCEEINKRSKETGPEKPMTIKEAAAFLQEAEKTTYTRTSNGTIPFHRKGKRGIRFFKSELVAWVKAGRNLTEMDYQQRAIEILTK